MKVVPIKDLGCGGIDGISLLTRGLGPRSDDGGSPL